MDKMTVKEARCRGSKLRWVLWLPIGFVKPLTDLLLLHTAGTNWWLSLTKKLEPLRRCTSFLLERLLIIWIHLRSSISSSMKLIAITYCSLSFVAVTLSVELNFHSLSCIQVKGSVRRGEDLKQYVELLRGKSITYKVLKKEMDDMAAEYGVLLRTQQLLERQAVDLPDLLDCNAFSGLTNIVNKSFLDSNSINTPELQTTMITDYRSFPLQWFFCWP